MKCALEENNNRLICIFHIVHNKFNNMLELCQSENIDIGVVLNDKESLVILLLLVHWSTDDRGFSIMVHYAN
jgi:hypothetical protein